MKTHDENPFVRFDLDPSATLAELIDRLRELTLDATTEEERSALRTAFELLARSPARRIELALAAGPRPDALPPIEAPRLPTAAFEPCLADVLTPGPFAAMVQSEAPRAPIDLRFLVRADEVAIVGDLERTGRRA